MRWNLGGAFVLNSDLSYTFSPGMRYLIVGTYNGLIVKIFINGIQQNSWPTSENIINQNGVTLGNETTDAHAFNG